MYNSIFCTVEGEVGGRVVLVPRAGFAFSLQELLCNPLKTDDLIRLPVHPPTSLVNHTIFMRPVGRLPYSAVLWFIYIFFRMFNMI